jgi:hypothetical protein
MTASTASKAPGGLAVVAGLLTLRLLIRSRFEINKRQPLAEGRSFGATGPYEQIDGTAHFGSPRWAENSP